MRRRLVAAMAVVAAGLGAPGLAPARADPVQPYQFNDGLGFHDILPPGTNGLDNGGQLAAWELNQARPPHNDDQLAMYRDLVYVAPHLRPEDLSRYYKDSSFGVKSGDVERTETPSSGGLSATIVRDRSFGVPHIYSDTRAGVMFGAGYAGAEDRLFFIDVLRHAGRAQLAGFIGGSKGNRDMDVSTLESAPYNESDLQAQLDRLPQLYGPDGQQVLDDINNFTAGINEYINEAKLDPNKMPAEYAALGHPQGPDPWKATDIVAEASLIGGIFGKGGGTQLAWGQILQSFQQRFGAGLGQQLWQDWREPNDPEAPTTIHSGSFPYQTEPATPAPGSVALPDQGSFTAASYVTATSGSGSAGTTARAARSARGPARRRSRRRTPATPAGAATPPRPALAFPLSASNALLVSGAHTVSGHPIAVMGPQVGYFTPQILMEEDLHGPGIDARGAAFAGVNLYVELGRGRDYAWSATSAGQDIVDDFAVDLCNPDGSAPSKASTHYVLRGQCVPMDPVVVSESWVPNPADTTPPGSQTMTVYRTAYGTVIGTATIGGKPVAYTELRSTYNHEIDSALGFLDFNNPDRMRNAQDFQRAAYRIGYTFNWFYVDDRDIAYFNSGNNPVRDPRVDPLLPVRAQFEWQGFNPSITTATYTPPSQHPQVVNQDYLTSWNNKQARDYGAADGFYSTVYRSQLLDDRIQAGMANGRKMSLTDLVNAMEDAGTVDLRGDKDLPWMLDVIGTPSDPQLATAVNELRAWVRDGAHRRAPSPDAPYDHSDAIRIMDAWWPLAVAGMFKPALGDALYNQITAQLGIDNPPNNGGGHLGSAYDNGWFGYVQKDLRDLLAQPATPAPAAGTAPTCTPARRRRHPRLCRTGQGQGQAAAVRGRRGQRQGQRPGAVSPTPAPQPSAPSAANAVLQPWHRVYCGNGVLAACRAMLLNTLRQALAVNPAQLYADSDCQAAGEPGGAQKCFDAIGFRAVGAITQPLTAWVNRPTYQQALEIQSHRPR